MLADGLEVRQLLPWHMIIRCLASPPTIAIVSDFGEQNQHLSLIFKTFPQVDILKQLLKNKKLK
jgi:hypothetical protein